MRVFQRVQHLLMALIYTVGFLSWAIAPSAHALAENPQQEDRDPAARVQIVLKSLHIRDDNDPGSGEFEAWMNLLCFSAPSPCLRQTSASIGSFAYRPYSGSTGATIALDEVHPNAGTFLNELSEASPQIGFPFYFGHRYEFRFNLIEKDPLTNPDKMGMVTLVIEQGQNWGLGEHTLRSVQANGEPGDFDLTFEIKPAPLPDLQPTSMTVTRPAGSAEHQICVAMLNRGALPSIGYPVVLFLDDAPQFIAVELGDALGSGQTDTVCLNAALPTSGLHTLRAIVDGARTVPEESELNNRLEQQYDPKGIQSTRPGGPLVGNQEVPPPPPVQATPPPAPPIRIVGQKSTTTPAPQADLSIGAIKVNGQEPDGKNDCKEGKNAVTIVVKSGGAADAEGFVVRLVIDGAEGSALDQTVSSLKAGQEREVKVDNVQLKKGERKLTVLVDAKGAIAESNDENNTRTVTATCQGAA